MYWNMLIFIDIYWDVRRYADVFWHTLTCMEMHCHVLTCTDICCRFLTLAHLSLVNSSSYGTFSANPVTIWCTIMPIALYAGWATSTINRTFWLRKLFITSPATNRQTHLWKQHDSVAATSATLSLFNLTNIVCHFVFHVHTTTELTSSGRQSGNIGQWASSLWLILLSLSAATVRNLQDVYKLLHADTTPCSDVALQRCWRLRRHGQTAQTERRLFYPEDRSTTVLRNASSCWPRPLHSEFVFKTWIFFR